MGPELDVTLTKLLMMHTTFLRRSLGLLRDDAAHSRHRIFLSPFSASIAQEDHFLRCRRIVQTLQASSFAGGRPPLLHHPIIPSFGRGRRVREKQREGGRWRRESSVKGERRPAPRGGERRLGVAWETNIYIRPCHSISALY